jgi:hypothetical protein
MADPSHSDQGDRDSESSWKSESSRKGLKKSGYLHLKRQGFAKRKKQFWFDYDPMSESLTYYSENPAESQKVQLVGTFSLEGSKIESHETKPRLIVKTKKTTFELQAESLKERDEWLQFVTSKTRLSAEELNLQEMIADMKKDPDAAAYIQSIEGAATGVEGLLPSTSTQPPESKSGACGFLDFIDDADTEPAPTIEKISKQKSGTEIFSIESYDVGSDKKVELGKLIGNTCTLIVLLRHFGCVLTKQMLAYLKDKTSVLEELGLQIMVVGHGSIQDAKNIRKDLRAKLLVDEGREFYKAIGCRRAASSCLTAKSLVSVKKALSEGHRQGPLSGGDPIQIGGVLVVSQKHGTIFKHIEEYAGNHANLDLLYLHMIKFHDQHPFDLWASTQLYHDWTELEGTVDQQNALINASNGFVGEFGKKDVVVPKELVITDSVQYYRTVFLGREHTVHLYEPDKDDELGPVVVAIRNAFGDYERKALIFTQNGIIKRVVPEYVWGSEKDMLKYLFKSVLHIDVSLSKVTKVDGEEVRQELCKFEQLNDAKNYKFGVLYCKTDQVKEGEMYANNKTSQDYEEFLDLLGERVPLKGWEKFGGGLDLGPTESTGTESIYLEIFDDYQVMYHVATLIPYKEDDEQQIDRKRHLGNDIVIIVFKEGTQKFDPTVIKSQFNQLFFVVQKEQRYDGVYYRLQIVNKAGIPPYPPYLPDPPVFVKGDEFRNFLLTKLINGERATIKESPNFKHKLMATRKSLLGEIVKTFSKPRRGSAGTALNLKLNAVTKAAAAEGSAPPSPPSPTTPLASPGSDPSTPASGRPPKVKRSKSRSKIRTKETALTHRSSKRTLNGGSMAVEGEEVVSNPSSLAAPGALNFKDADEHSA